MINKYKLYSVENPLLEQCILHSTTPTECPNGDTVNASSITLIEDDVKSNFGNVYVDSALSLSDYKELRYGEIDYKTGQLIAAGFVYDSKTFSLSSRAQFNWDILKVNTAEFTWPKNISTTDSDSYSLAQANVDAFWTAGKNAVNGHLDSGRVLKKSVYDAVDKAAVDAVLDNR